MLQNIMFIFFLSLLIFTVWIAPYYYLARKYGDTQTKNFASWYNISKVDKKELEEKNKRLEDEIFYLKQYLGIQFYEEKGYKKID